jgi:hypothetical protein
MCLHAIYFLGRKIETMSKDSIRAISLIQSETPNFRAINRFAIKGKDEITKELGCALIIINLRELRNNRKDTKKTSILK